MKFTQNVKRGVAMLLTLAMLVSSGNFGLIFSAIAESGDHDDHFHATLGQVIIDNLDSLTAQQKYLLKNGYLVADEQYHFAPPEDSTGLVVVNSAEKTVTAKAYTDSEGNLWVPTEFSLTGDENAILESGVLTADGEVYTGSYTATEENFSVHITYSFELNLSPEEKEAVKAMVNAGASLNADLELFDYLDTVSVLSGIDDATKAKIMALVGGVDPNAELVLKAMVMELDQLGGQTAVDLLASLAKDGIYLPLLEDDGNGNISVNEQGVFVNLGQSTSAAYLGAMSLKQQQDAQNALNLIKVLDDYIELSDLALLAMQADKLEAALNGNYADLGAVSAGLKENVQPAINKYLTETVPSIYGTVFATINDALAAYEFNKIVNSSEELAALIAELKATYADGLAQINEKLAGTDYDKNGSEAGAGISTPEDIAALKLKLEKDYADSVKQINDLLGQYGYNGAPVTDSTSLDAPIQWADELYTKALKEINDTLAEYGYTGKAVTNSTGMNRPIIWLEDEYAAAIDEINALLEEYGYEGDPVTKSEGMDAPIAWLDAQYAESLAAINGDMLPVLRENLGITCDDVASSADIAPIITAIGTLRTDWLAEANEAAAAYGMTVTNEEELDALITKLKDLAAFVPPAAEALEAAKALKEALEGLATIVEQLELLKTVLESMEQAKVALVEAKAMLAQAEEALEMLSEAQRELVKVEEAQAMIPEVKEKMELAEFAIEALGLMSQANEAIVKLDEVQSLLTQFDEGVAELEEQSDNLKLLVIIMDGFTATVKPVVDAFGSDSINTSKLLKSGLSAETYANIETAIAGATAYTGQIPEKLTVAKTTLIVNVAKFNVNIKYQASVVDPFKTDSADTIQLPVYEETIALNGGATGAEVMEAVAATGFLNNALAQWGIDESKFDVQAQVLANDFKLNQDLEYTVVITPKTYQLTLDFGGTADVLDVPYGYRYTAPVHENSKMEYVYTVITGEITELEQGSVLVVEENVTVNRTEGAMAERLDLLDLVAKTVETDTDIKNILTSSALKLSNVFRMRLPGKDQVTVFFDTGKQATVVAAPNYDSRVGTLQWIAKSVTIEGTTYPITNGLYDAVTNGKFKQADVHYQLALTPEALGVNAAVLLDAMNTPYKLAADYKAQKAILDELVDLMPLLKKLNDEDDVISEPTSMTLREALGMLDTLKASYGFSDETVAAGKALYKLIPVDGHVALYDTMELYTHGGMYHYYKNEALYKTQITQLDDILKILVNDQAFMNLVHTASQDLFEEIKNTMDTAADVMNNHGVDHSKIDVADQNLRTLLKLLETSNPTLYSSVPADFLWQQDVHVTGLGYTNVTVNVSFGGVTYTEDHVEETGTTLTVDRLLAWAEEMKAAHNIGPEYPEHYKVSHDFENTVLTGSAVEFNYTWDVKDYKIVVDGTDVVVGNVNFNYMHLDLPAHTVAGMRYDYKIGDLAVQNGGYELTVDQFNALVAGTMKVTRTEVNEEQERLQKQEDRFVDFVNHMEGAGIVTKDANGKYSFIFRIDNANAVDSFTRFAMGLFMGGYDHIGLDNHVFYGEGQYRFQSLIDALLHSGAGTHTILDKINSDGTLEHLALPNTAVLTKYSYPTLGAELMKTTAYFEKDGETLEADFYITMDGAPSQMKKLKDNVAKIDKYLKVTLEDGQVITHLTMPDTVYATYVAALAATGKIDLRHVNDLDTQVALAFLFELFNPMLDKDTAEWDAIMNTADMLVNGVGVGKIENAYDKVLDRVNTDQIGVIYELLTGAYDSEKVVYSDKSVYVPLENIRVKEVLDKVQAKLNAFIADKGVAMSVDLSKIVYEYNSGVNVNLTGHVENLDTEYAALYVDIKADGLTNKAGLATAAELPTIAQTANLIILLDDVTADLNLNGNEISIKGKTLNVPVLVDLNGKTLTGNIAGDGKVVILDSAYQSDVAPVGTVTGSVTGATVISGTYKTDVSACLPDGYVQEANGAVHHKLFTVVDDGANNLTLTLNADYDDLLEMIDKKGLLGVAADAAMEIALNNYIYSSLYLDGKQIFDIQAEDLVGMIAGDNKKQDFIDTLKSWVSKEDLKAIAQDILDVITDYDALHEALKDGGDGVIYKVDTLVTPFDITTEKIENNGKPYYTVNIGSGTEKTGSLTVVVVGDMRLELLKLAKALKDVVQNNVSVDISIDDVSVDLENKTLFVTGDFAGEVVVDFRNDPEYVLMTAVILAYGNPEIRDDLVAAINAYYAEDSMEEMEKVFNTLSAKQIIAGWNKVERGVDFFTAMVNSLALSDDAKTDILAAIDDDMLGFKLAVELGAAILRKLGVEGSDRTLGSFLKNDSESGDNYYGIAKSKDFIGEKNPLQDYNDILTENNPFKDYNEYLGEKNPLWDYSVNYDISIENVSGKLFLFHVHKWDNGVEISAPDCENEGEILYTCTACGHTKTEKIPANGHNYGDLIELVKPDCENTGVAAHYYCSVCGKYFDENKNEVAYADLIIPANGHNYGDLIELVKPDCENTGVAAHYYCSVCGKYFDENKNEVAYADLIIPANGHNYKWVEEVPAEVGKPGMKGHYYCDVCGKYFDENKNEVTRESLIIPPLSGDGAPVLGEALVNVGHIYGAAIRTENGVKYLIVDAHPHDGLKFFELHAMFPAITNDVKATKTTTLTDMNGAPVVAADTDKMATSYTVTYTATNEFGSDAVTYILVILGDVNCDGRNTSSDAAAIKKFKLDNEPFGTRAQELAADINCDGTITSSDANTIKLKVLNSVNSDYAYVTKVPTLAIDESEERNNENV